LTYLCVSSSQHFINQIHSKYTQTNNTSRHKFQYLLLMFMWIQSLLFQRWSERRTKAKLNFAFLNLCPFSASYSKGQTVKVLSLSLSHWFHCRADRTLSSCHPVP
jgi:hypothetical protein